MFYTFKSAISMANWINSNIPDPAKGEKLMFEGIQHKKINGTYTIFV